MIKINFRFYASEISVHVLLSYIKNELLLRVNAIYMLIQKSFVKLLCSLNNVVEEKHRWPNNL